MKPTPPLFQPPGGLIMSSSPRKHSLRNRTRALQQQKIRQLSHLTTLGLGMLLLLTIVSALTTQ